MNPIKLIIMFALGFVSGQWVEYLDNRRKNRKSAKSKDCDMKHGKWIGVDYDTFYECSECKHLTDWKLYEYCPYCGARMDAEPDEPWQSE